MPDFERVFDQMRIDLARTPEERAHAEGFIAGKKYARKEIAYMAAFITAVGVFLWALVSAS